MHRSARLLLTTAFLFLAASYSCAGPTEKPSKPEQLPAPKKAEAGRILEDDPGFPEYYFRTSRYDVWQYYGVDRTGHFRPRVIYSPYGAYYLHNGEPYPWATTHQRDFMPYVAD